MIRIVHPGSGARLRIPAPDPGSLSRIRILFFTLPGSRGQKGTGSRIPAPQHWLVMKLDKQISGLNSPAILVTPEDDKYSTGPTPMKAKNWRDLKIRPDYKKKKSHKNHNGREINYGTGTSGCRI
jgi:hypothetical protein